MAEDRFPNQIGHRPVTCLVGVALVGLTVGYMTAAEGSAESQGQPDPPLGLSVESSPTAQQETASLSRLETVSEIEKAITSLRMMTPRERERVIPSLLSAITRQSESVRARLGQVLQDELREDSSSAETWSEDDAQPPPGEQESFERLRKEEEKMPASEEAIRSAIEALTFDPHRPEVSLNRALELGGAIERIEDPELQLTLKKLLNDRVDAFPIDTD